MLYFQERPKVYHKAGSNPIYKTLHYLERLSSAPGNRSAAAPLLEQKNRTGSAGSASIVCLFTVRCFFKFLRFISDVLFPEYSYAWFGDGCGSAAFAASSMAAFLAAISLYILVKIESFTSPK